jgi:hypothetical protein
MAARKTIRWVISLKLISEELTKPENETSGSRQKLGY